MRMLISLFLLLFFAFLSAYVAKQRGRDPVAWFMIGILLGIFAPILLLILKPLNLDHLEIGQETEINEDIKLSPLGLESKSYMDKEWFYLDQGNQQYGPLDFSRLKDLWLEQKIHPNTYIWSEGMEQWKRIHELPGFIESL